MSSWTAGLAGPDTGSACGGDRVQRAASTEVRRVRQEVRDGVAVACFSAGASLVLALAMLAIVTLVGQHAA